MAADQRYKRDGTDVNGIHLIRSKRTSHLGNVGIGQPAYSREKKH